MMSNRKLDKMQRNRYIRHLFLYIICMHQIFYIIFVAHIFYIKYVSNISISLHFIEFSVILYQSLGIVNSDVMRDQARFDKIAPLGKDIDISILISEDAYL